MLPFNGVSLKELSRTAELFRYNRNAYAEHRILVSVFFLKLKVTSCFINFMRVASSGGVDDASKVQTLLFSATMPEWVKKVLSYLLSYVLQKLLIEVANVTIE